MKKRAKYQLDFIQSINMRLRNMRIKNENDSLVSFAQAWLLDKQIYNGFQWFKTESGRSVMCPPQDAEYIQFF